MAKYWKKHRIFGSSKGKMTKKPLHPLHIEMPPEPVKTLVLFDFDGTISSSDSLWRFLWEALGLWKTLKGIPEVAFRFIKLALLFGWHSGVAKQQLMATYFTGMSREDMCTMGAAFLADNPRSPIFPEVLAWIRAYRTAGCRVVVVSASFDVWLSAFCAAEDLELICTRLAFVDNKFTGKFETPNCNYEEKKKRIAAAIDLGALARCIAYGNSRGDFSMFELSDQAWMRCSKQHFYQFKP
jgi:HAD superfamily phosphoserine phosphatase-like hydrolase